MSDIIALPLIFIVVIIYHGNQGQLRRAFAHQLPTVYIYACMSVYVCVEMCVCVCVCVC